MNREKKRGPPLFFRNSVLVSKVHGRKRVGGAWVLHGARLMKTTDPVAVLPVPPDPRTCDMRDGQPHVSRSFQDLISPSGLLRPALTDVMSYHTFLQLPVGNARPVVPFIYYGPSSCRL